MILIDKLQKKISNVLIFLSNVSNNLPSNFRKNAFYIFMGLIFLQYWLIGTSFLNLRYLHTFTLGCICLGFAVFLILPKTFRKVYFDTALSWILTLLGVFVLLSGIISSENHLPNAIWLLIILPTIIYVFSNLDNKDYTEKLINVSNFSFVAFMIICMLFFPVDNWRQYKAFFSNVNGASEYLTITFATLLAKSFSMEKDAKYSTRIFYYGLIGLNFALVFYTNSRTGQLSCLCAFVFSAILKIIKNRQNLGTICCVYILPVILSAGIFVGSTITIINTLPTVTSKVSTMATDVLGNQKEDNVESETNTEKISVKTYIEYNNLKTDVDGKDISQYSTGRTVIWEEYLEQINLFGHDSSYKFFIEGRNGYNATAHMTILQYAYDSGIFAGCFFFLLNIVAGIKSVMHYFKNKDEEYSITPFVVTIGFGITSVLSSCVSPFRYVITLYYYFFLTPLFKKQVGEFIDE